ncbi:MAG: HNH endonuclease [Chloroflexota bacterium]
MSRAYIPIEVRRQVLAADGHRYAYCRSSELLSGIPLSLDHITPVSAGGANLFGNLCSACRPCNEYKSKRRFAFDSL